MSPLLKPNKMFRNGKHIGFGVVIFALIFLGARSNLPNYNVDVSNVPWVRKQARSLPPAPPPGEGFYSFIQQLGFRPRFILDVGANQGDWARMIWSQFGHTGAEVLMVEGSVNRTATLATSGFSYIISVVGAASRHIEFYAKDSANTGNSVLQETTAHFKDVKPQMVQMRTIDQLVRAYPCNLSASTPVLMKLDVQGYEVEVLKGATATLQYTDFIVMETSVVPWNKGAPLVADVIHFMDTIGFQVFDFIEAHKFSGVLLQLDFAFVRKQSKYVELARSRAGILV